MSEQLIIAVSREFGSGGHVIAQNLADRFGLPLYDKNLLQEYAGIKNLDAESLERYDEVPRNRLLTRKVNGHSSSPSENVANIQFDYLRQKADAGESFVVVGRCAESVLSEYDCMIPIFVLGDRECKIQRVMERENRSRAEAEARIARVDRKRKEYHNYYCTCKWGDSRNYDICINSSKLGLDGTTDVLEGYIRAKLNKK